MPPPDAVAPSEGQRAGQHGEVGENAIEIGDEGEDSGAGLGHQGEAERGDLRHDEEAPRPDEVSEEGHPVRGIQVREDEELDAEDDRGAELQEQR